MIQQGLAVQHAPAAAEAVGLLLVLAGLANVEAHQLLRVRLRSSGWIVVGEEAVSR